MCFRELNRGLNKHCFKSLFSSLFRMKGDLISQNRRVGVPELGVRQIALSVEQPTQRRRRVPYFSSRTRPCRGGPPLDK